MSDPKIAESVIVHRHPAADPAIRIALTAEPVEFPGTGDPLGGGVEPKCDQYARIGGSSAWLLAPRADCFQKETEIPRGDNAPDGAGVVVAGEKLLERARTH
jgi:hypothetical protein